RETRADCEPEGRKVRAPKLRTVWLTRDASARAPPSTQPAPPGPPDMGAGDVVCRERLSGLLKHYSRRAAWSHGDGKGRAPSSPPGARPGWPPDDAPPSTARPGPITRSARPSGWDDTSRGSWATYPGGGRPRYIRSGYWMGRVEQ